MKNPVIGVIDLFRPRNVLRFICIMAQRQTKGSEHVQSRLGRLPFASLEPNMDDTLSIFLELLFCAALVPFPACSGMYHGEIF